MNHSTKDRVRAKIFVGFAITLELSLELKKSTLWKQARLIKSETKDSLEIVHYNSADYIGQYFELSMITINDIREFSTEIKNKVGQFVPSFNIDSLEMSIFPQTFIS